MPTDVRSIASRLDEQGIEFDSAAQDRLDRNLSRSNRGYSLDLRTPFADERPREEITERYKESIGFTSFAEMTKIDEKEISKIGPYSIMLPWSERRDSVNDFKRQKYSGNEMALDYVIHDIAHLFPPSCFRPMGIGTAVDAMPHNTMLGMPTMSSDKAFIPDYQQRANDPMSKICPAVAGWRGQPKGLHETPKQRLVWMMDHLETIWGLTILYPVLNRLRVLTGFSAWSSDVAVDDAVTTLLEKAENQGLTIISADYSNFDASVPAHIIQCVFDLLRYWFTDETESRLDVLESSFSTLPLITPDGVFEGRNGGVPSGSALTNLVDTLVNLIAGKYAAKRLGIELMSYEVLGDDSIFVFKPTPKLEDLSAAFMELGLDSNPEKQFVSTRSAHFLQRWHSLDYRLSGKCRGVRSIYRTLNGMMSLERWINTETDEIDEDSKFKYLMSARIIMQANNVRWHPMFKEFVELMKEDDKILKTGIDPTTVFRRAGGSDAIRSALSIASYPFNQQDPDMVDEFAVTAVLRELA